MDSESSLSSHDDNAEKRSENSPTTTRKKYACYDFQFKLDVVRYAETHSQSVTSAKFGIDPKRIREWKKQKPVIVVMSSTDLNEDERSRSCRERRDHTANDGHGGERHSNDGSLNSTEVCEIKQELMDDDGVLITENEEEDSCEEWDDDDEDINLPGVVVPQLGGNGVGRRVKNQFTLKQKLEAIRYLENHSVNATSRFFGVATKSIREWRNKKDIIERLVREELLAYEQGNVDEDTPSPRKRIPGAGRKKRPKEPEKLDENPNKRHRRSLEVNEKVEIIKLIENGMTQSDVARQLRFSQSTVQTIWSNKHHIMTRYLNPKKKWKNLHWKRYSDINDALLTWYKQCKDSSVPVDSKSIIAKAVELADNFKKPEFKSQSERWVTMFKKRHGIIDFGGKSEKRVTRSGNINQLLISPNNMHQNQPNLPSNSHPYQSSLLSQNHLHPNIMNSSMNVGGTPNQSHDLVPDFDLTSLPSIIHGLYPSSEAANSSGGVPSNFDSHLPPAPASSMPVVTTCDAMKYVELIRSWAHNTYGQVGTSAETLSNHLNAIENLVLKRRMTEMQDHVNSTSSASHR